MANVKEHYCSNCTRFINAMSPTGNKPGYCVHQEFLLKIHVVGVGFIDNQIVAKCKLFAAKRSIHHWDQPRAANGR